MIKRGIIVAIMTCLGCTILFAIWGHYDLINIRRMLGIGFVGFLFGLAGNENN